MINNSSRVKRIHVDEVTAVHEYLKSAFPGKEELVVSNLFQNTSIR